MDKKEVVNKLYEEKTAKEKAVELAEWVDTSDVELVEEILNYMTEEQVNTLITKSSLFIEALETKMYDAEGDELDDELDDDFDDEDDLDEDDSIIFDDDDLEDDFDDEDEDDYDYEE